VIDHEIQLKFDQLVEEDKVERDFSIENDLLDLEDFHR
jgi:hypothetical protein